MYFPVFGNDEWPVQLWPKVYMLEIAIAGLLAACGPLPMFSSPHSFKRWVIRRLKASGHWERIESRCQAQFVDIFLEAMGPVMLSSIEAMRSMTEDELLLSADSPLHPDKDKILQYCRASVDFKAFVSSYASELSAQWSGAKA